MDKAKERIWIEAVLDRFSSKVKGNPDSATEIFEGSVGALQKQLDVAKSVAIRPIKLGPHEKQDVYIDLAHIVERGKTEIGEAKQLLRKGRSMQWIVEEFLPKTRVLRRVIAHYVEREGFDRLDSIREEILTPTLHKEGNVRGRPRTARYMLDYLASACCGYGVDKDLELDTIKVWISKGQQDAKEYAKNPERMVTVFGLDLPTLQGMSEEARESLLLGKSVSLSNGKTIALTTLGPIGISDLSDQIK